MSSQFVDMNGDGFNDIIVGIYSGIPQIIMGGKEGYEPSKPIVDVNGEAVLISKFWDDKGERKKWTKASRCGSVGHCTSVTAVDWDNDGDLDLLLGDYDGGRLFLRINDGSKESPKFASKNVAVKAGGKPIQLKRKIAASVVVDWNKDGMFDIVCGGVKGGVSLFLNEGGMGEPKFAVAKTLIEPAAEKVASTGTVPAFQGLPTQPASSLHIAATDYDGDGDLDLLVGGRCVWAFGEKPKPLTDDEKEAIAKVSEELKVVNAERQALLKPAKGSRERLAVLRSEEFEEVLERYLAITRKRSDLTRGRSQAKKSGDFIWLFRRK